MSDPSRGLPANLRGAVDLSGLVRRASAPAPTQASGTDAVVIRTDDVGFGDLVERSRTVPVLVEFADERTGPTGVDEVVRSYGGRLVLAIADLAASEQLIQAFQVQQVPFLAAVIGGRPLPLFAGVMPEAELRDVLDQVLQLAEQQGITGVVEVDAEATGEPEPEPLPPLHQEAYDAIADGDYARAVRAYETAIAQNPRDDLAKAGLAQVRLLDRLQQADAEAVRRAAAEAPDDVAAQLAVADLDLSGGHAEDAIGRLLDVFAAAAPADRETLRARLLEFFEILGPEDPRVAAGRRRLAALLY